MHSKDTKIEFNQYQKSDTAPSIVFADHQPFIKKVNGCKLILKNYPQQK